MRTATLRTMLAALGGLAALGVGAASGQDLPQYRDSRTGTVWVPQMPTEEAAAATTDSSYMAFDPRSQNVRVRGVVVQHPRANLMGTVPITAGPAVPLMTIDAPSLQVIAGRHWLSILYVTNNSAGTIDAVVGCRFANQDRTVEVVRVMVPPAGPGERLGVPVRGPAYDVFVDRITCNLLTPS